MYHRAHHRDGSVGETRSEHVSRHTQQHAAHTVVLVLVLVLVLGDEIRCDTRRDETIRCKRCQSAYSSGSHMFTYVDVVWCVCSAAPYQIQLSSGPIDTTVRRAMHRNHACTVLHHMQHIHASHASSCRHDSCHMSNHVPVLCCQWSDMHMCTRHVTCTSSPTPTSPTRRKIHSQDHGMDSCVHGGTHIHRNSHRWMMVSTARL